ncbi:uncharacterized protein LOC120355278 [Nilaparvata lugens]|uniref:uncharacterized protein LOC120355278 n=1 Tax=Nilaparvata lugens TaxID=108931 RepID=UPI00193CD851|nr:uncharacterized protein LOC120355278 [Nilaparvata lugens]
MGSEKVPLCSSVSLSRNQSVIDVGGLINHQTSYASADYCHHTDEPKMVRLVGNLKLGPRCQIIAEGKVEIRKKPGQVEDELEPVKKIRNNNRLVQLEKSQVEDELEPVKKMLNNNRLVPLVKSQVEDELEYVEKLCNDSQSEKSLTNIPCSRPTAESVDDQRRINDRHKVSLISECEKLPESVVIDPINLGINGLLIA